MSNHHNHCHDHHHEACCEHDECCSYEESCGSHHHHHEHEDFAHQLIKLADEAWMEVVKDKIKEQIKATNGAHLDKLAKLVSDSNHERWKHKLATNKGLESYREQLSQLFCPE